NQSCSTTNERELYSREKLVPNLNGDDRADERRDDAREGNGIDADVAHLTHHLGCPRRWLRECAHDVAQEESPQPDVSKDAEKGTGDAPEKAHARPLHDGKRLRRA